MSGSQKSGSRGFYCTNYIYQNSRTTWTNEHRFICRSPDPEAMGAYAFPPFDMIGRVLTRVRNENLTLIIIVPEWPSYIWYATLLEMLIESALLLPQLPNLLLSPARQPHPLIMNRTLRLLACKISW